VVIWAVHPGPLRNGADAWLPAGRCIVRLPHLYCAPLFLVLFISHLERGALARSPDNALEVWMGMAQKARFSPWACGC